MISVFKDLFKMDIFVANENNVFAITHGGKLSEFRQQFQDRRDVSRLLGEPMAEMFGVSIETMAIRLEELNLVDY